VLSITAPGRWCNPNSRKDCAEQNGVDAFAGRERGGGGRDPGSNPDRLHAV